MSTTQGEVVLATPVTPDRDHIRGPVDAAMTLVEYGDFECPYSGAAYPIIKEIQARLGDRFRFVFRNYPLVPQHSHAQLAAEAAEAAGAQGKYWEMYDVLFENRKRLRDHDLRDYANKLELDLERFDIELARHIHAGRVYNDFLSGVKSGVTGTPTFYVNGVKRDDPPELDSLLAALEATRASND